LRELASLEQRANLTGMLFRRLAYILPAAVCAAALLPAQLQSQDAALITGTVMTQDKRPIQNARLKVVGTDLIAESREDGTFRVWGIPAGHHSLEVRMLGYSTGMIPFDIASGANLVLPVTLVPVALTLDTVTVSSLAGLTPAMRGFEDRRARGTGRFFTRKEIRRMQARSFTDILRRAPGIQIQSVNSLFGRGDAVRSQRTGGVMGTRACPMLFYINGAPFPLSQDLTINHYLSPDDVEAVEVYNGASEIPPQFNSGMFNARCGVVVVWTRHREDPVVSR